MNSARADAPLCGMIARGKPAIVNTLGPRDKSTFLLAEIDKSGAALYSQELTFVGQSKN